MIFGVINLRLMAARRLRYTDDVSKTAVPSTRNFPAKMKVSVVFFSFFLCHDKASHSCWTVLLEVVFACLIRFWEVRLVL